MTVPAEVASLTTRHADLGDLAALLHEQQARKVDVVVPPSELRARGGMLVIAGTEPVLTDTGVDLADGIYRPTAVCDEESATSSASTCGTCASSASRRSTCTT